MSQRRFAVLRAEIRRELGSVQRLVAEAAVWRPDLGNWPERVRVRTVGGILHDFYCGVERIFRQIAIAIDEDMPEGAEWHVQLLQRMATDLEAVRPAVLDDATASQLDEYLRFRHLFRHVYGFELKWERCRALLEQLPVVCDSLKRQLDALDAFLQALERQV